VTPSFQAKDFFFNETIQASTKDHHFPGSTLLMKLGESRISLRSLLLQLAVPNIFLDRKSNISLLFVASKALAPRERCRASNLAGRLVAKPVGFFRCENSKARMGATWVGCRVMRYDFLGTVSFLLPKEMTLSQKKESLFLISKKNTCQSFADEKAFMIRRNMKAIQQFSF